jgi:hypothetical protein
MSENLLVNVQIANPGDGDNVQAAAALERMRGFEIMDTATYQIVASDLASIKGQWETVEAKRVKLKKPILEAGRGIDELFASPLGFLKQAEAIAKSKLDAWTREQARLAKIEQDRLDLLARKERERVAAAAAEVARKAAAKAEEDRKAAAAKLAEEQAERRKAQEAETARLRAEHEAEEARAAGDREAELRAQRQATEAAAASSAAFRASMQAAGAASKLETRAASTEQRGAEKAEMLSMQAASVVAPTVVVDVPKVKGLSSRQVWEHEVTDLNALIDAVIAGKAPRIYLAANDKTLGAMAKAQESQFNCPGVKAFPKTITASKATR